MQNLTRLFLLLSLAGAALCQALPDIGYPLAEVRPGELRKQFRDKRRGHIHQANDLMRPRGTPILAVADGTVRKLIRTRTGGISIFQFDAAEEYCYFFAHIDHYAKGLREGQQVHRGDVIAYVGSTGNALRSAPHLHFAVSLVLPDKRFWGGKVIDPYPLLLSASTTIGAGDDSVVAALAAEYQDTKQ